MTIDPESQDKIRYICKILDGTKGLMAATILAHIAAHFFFDQEDPQLAAEKFHLAVIDIMIKRLEIEKNSPPKG